MKIGDITTDPTDIKKRTLLPTYIYKFDNETKTDKSLRYSVHIKRKCNCPYVKKKKSNLKLRTIPKENPGLRGFSIKHLRKFYQTFKKNWHQYYVNAHAQNWHKN